MGDDVAGLQQNLSQHGFKIPVSEAGRRFFGPTTLEAVLTVQRQNHVQATGQVDATTADLLMGVPAAPAARPMAGILRPGAGVGTRAPMLVGPVGGIVASVLQPTKTQTQGPAPARVGSSGQAQFVVSGSVENAVPGLRAAAYARSVRSETLLGESPISDGRYEIHYGVAKLNGGAKPTANLRIAVLGADGHELASSGIQYNAGPTAEVNLVLDVAPLPGSSEYERLDATVTPARGDLELRDLNDEPSQPGQAVGDVDFIAGATRQDRQRIDWLVKAAKLAAVSGARSNGAARSAVPALAPAATTTAQAAAAGAIPATALYAWFRLGLPTTPDALWATPVGKLVATLKSAVAQQIIPPLSNSAVEAITGAVRQAQAVVALQAPRFGKTASLGDLLGTMGTPLDTASRQALGAAAAKLRADDPKLVETIGGIAGFNGDAAAVARTVRLGALTQGNVALAAALQDKLSGDEQAAAGTLAPLAKLKPDQWIDLAYTHGAPAGSELTPVAYADALAEGVERDNPTAALAAHIETRRLGQQPGLVDVGTFLRNNPSFDIRAANLSAPDSKLTLDGVADSKQLFDGLRGLQRMNTLGARWDEAAALLANGVTSPHRVLMEGPTQLGNLLDGQVAPERIAQLYNGAGEMFGTTFAAYTSALSPLSAPQPMPQEFKPAVSVSHDQSRVPRAVPPAPADGGAGSALQKGGGNAQADGGGGDGGADGDGGPVAVAIGGALGNQAQVIIDADPTLQRLFGPQDSCACEDCQSVLSPSAYFVDVLQFLKDAKRLRELLARRPDLADVELSCNNTNTPVPAIDLALEILENAVALPLDVPLKRGVQPETELNSKPVGASVREALLSTVRSLAGNVNATLVDSPSEVTSNWVVVDGRRRWTLTVQRKVVRARSAAGQELMLNTGSDVVDAVVSALDQGAIASGAEAAFAAVLAGNQSSPPDLTNYQVTIVPITAGQSWQLTYQAVAQLVIRGTTDLSLQTPQGVQWFDSNSYDDGVYDENTIKAALEDLKNLHVPDLVKWLMKYQFPGTTAFTVDRVGPPLSRLWNITSNARTLTLWYSPASLKITSLAYQSGDTSVDAIAWPENHNPAAYAKLKGDDATFPWTLPVDLPCEEVRLFLKRSRSSRRKLMELMAPIATTADDPATVREVLGLTEAEANLIAPSAPPNLNQTLNHWGLSGLGQAKIWDSSIGKDYTAADGVLLLQNVSILLQQSRLSFEDLEAVLATQFVQPPGTLPPLSITPRGSCLPSEMRIYGLGAPALERVHRFVRLWHRLGWSIADADAALGTFANNTLDAAGLQALASLPRLLETVNLPPAKVIAWFANPPAAQRDGELARALKIGAVDLADATALFGVVGAFVNVSDTLQLCARIASIEERNLAFRDLRYLLLDDPAPASDVELTETSRVALANAARDAVRSIPDATAAAAPLDPAGDVGSKALNAVIAALADRLGAPRALVDDLLRVRLKHPTIAGQAAITVFLDNGFFGAPASPSLAAPVETVIVRLHKAVAICAALELGAPDLLLLRATFLATEQTGLTAFDFNMLPTPAAPAQTPAGAVIKGFEQLLAVLDARDLAKGTAGLLRQYATLDFTDAALIHNVRTLLGAGLSQGTSISDEAQVQAAADQLQITTADEYRDPLVLLRLLRLLLELKGLGATVKLAQGFIVSSPTDDQALPARDLLQLKYSDSSWRDLVKPIADALRQRQRDALVDYLIARDNRAGSAPPTAPYLPPLKPLRDANDLYERYLIDVETGTCLTTTRLLAATGAAQLFVQRCLLNLEGPTSFTDDKRERWSWMERYRVWEANREVFLFPENWLLPELRDDKTEIFSAMEGTLADQEPSLESTRDALIGYLEEFSELAQIATVGMYDTLADTQAQGSGDRTLYVVGRTPDQPFRYFWRSCTNFGDQQAMYWSGWEALDLDNPNDYVMPFVFEGDLHVAWPTFQSTVDSTTENEKDRLKWEVKLAWIRRTARGWTKRKLATYAMATTRLINLSPERSFTFRLSKATSTGTGGLTGEGIGIACYAANESLSPNTGPFTEGYILLRDTPMAGQYVCVDINCTFKAKFQPQGADKPLYEDLPGVSMFLDYTDKHGQPSNPTTSFATQGLNIEADSGSTIRATFTHADSADHVIAISLQDQNGQNDYHHWQVFITVVFDTTGSPSHSYASDRDIVDYEHAGTFSMDALHEVSVLPPANGTLTPLFDGLHESVAYGADDGGNPMYNPIVGRVCGNGFRFGRLFSDLRVPAGTITNIDRGTLTNVTVTPSGPFDPNGDALSADPSGPLVLYFQDDTRRFFLDLNNGTASVWPDGQAFVRLYRWLTATQSTFKIFARDVEATPLDGQVSTLAAGEVETADPAISFARDDTYANYNWELFLHLPLAIADYLVKQQRFEVARLWLRAVLDPTAQLGPGLVPQFWAFLPFDNNSQPAAIADLLAWLTDPSHAGSDLSNALGAQIDAWKANPFMPHLIARMRPSAYQWWTFFAQIQFYLGWGDQLFRQDTRESVNEATLLYILADKLLGPHPQTIPADPSKPVMTYRTLTRDGTDDLAEFSEAWLKWTDQPGMMSMLTTRADRTTVGNQVNQTFLPPPHLVLASLSGLAFCVPRNSKIDELRDAVDLRLNRIRNCQNIDGVSRELPYYDPAIDPLLLIKAKAAGLDLSELPLIPPPSLPLYRFTTSLQRANELAAEVKALGAALLAALERKDGADLDLLRSKHEIGLLTLVRDTRQRQVDEADAAIVALQQSKETTQQRLTQFQSLLGQTSASTGQDGLPLVAQSSMLTVATDASGDASGLGLSLKEIDHLNLSHTANDLTTAAGIVNVIAGIASAIPNFSVGSCLYQTTFGGSNLGPSASAVAKAIELLAADKNFGASRHLTLGGYERRQDDWVYQSKLAVAEMKQHDRQILAAQIRKDIAQKELDSHQTQIDNAKELNDFLRSKFTNKELQSWMSSTLADVYFKSYQLALDLAQRAELACRRELGLSNGDLIVQSAYWDNLRQGLLAGEQLSHNLKRLEAAYFDQNKRELEITKRVSVAQLDPLALILLKETGSCTVFIPEVVFDLDYAGHYFRRLKNLEISIPCVVGPHANVSCTLRLKRHSYRTDASATSAEDYAADPFEPGTTKFVPMVEDQTSRQYVATSSAQNDGGLFETNLRDERYLPFEGAGAISEWDIELPSTFRPFDYDTISDVIFHLRFTARDTPRIKGGDLRGAAQDSLTAALSAIQDGVEKSGPLARVFSLRHEFPSEWYRFLNPPVDPTVDASLTLTLSKDRFPAIFRDPSVKLRFAAFEILVAVNPDYLDANPPTTIKMSFQSGPHVSSAPLDLSAWSETRLFKASPTASGNSEQWTLAVWLQPPPTGAGAPVPAHARLAPNALQDVLLVCRYSVSS